jgi:hypothetical protein
MTTPAFLAYTLLALASTVCAVCLACQRQSKHTRMEDLLQEERNFPGAMERYELARQLNPTGLHAQALQELALTRMRTARLIAAWLQALPPGPMRDALAHVREGCAELDPRPGRLRLDLHEYALEPDEALIVAAFFALARDPAQYSVLAPVLMYD